MAPASGPGITSYRPDIDGLRAVAVLSVILFHIDKTLLPGGFVGVDIFFVISGYLISLHIFRDLQRQRFSIVEFYRRRIKRIMPAMLAVVLIVVALSQVILRPADAEGVAESGLWSLLSMANVYFWLYEDTSYFAAASSQKPLLHLWSLGIEEQFYLFWPLILLLTHRIGHGRHFFALFSVLALASFCAGEYWFSQAPSFVYYMLPTRAGELLTGALVAHLIMHRGSIRIPAQAVFVLALTGLALVAASLFLLSEHAVFPGLRALPPTLGAALIIVAGHFRNTLPTRVLTVRPMVRVGLVSYSAYLWHWPLLAFYRYGNFQITPVSGLLLFAATLLLAFISYRLIEKPFRQSPGNAWQTVIRQFMLPTAVIGLICVAAMKVDGYGLRWFSEAYRSELTALRDETRPAYQYDYVCQHQTITANDIQNPECVLPEGADDQASVILWGDSNAAHYIGIIGTFAREAGFRFRNLQIGACPPITADPAPFVQLRRLEDCRKFSAIMASALQHYPVIIISANWPAYQARSAQFLETFFETARSLQHSHIVLIGKGPVISGYDRLCREKQLSFPFVSCTTAEVPLAADIVDINRKLAEFAQQNKNIEYTDFNRHLCPDDMCSLYDSSGRVMYYDASHLSLPASWRVGQELVNEQGVPFPFRDMAERPVPGIRDRSLARQP